MLGPDVSVIERPGFLGCKRQDLLHARRIGNVAQHPLVGPVPTCFSTSTADAFQVEAEFLKDINRYALPQLNDPKQQVFGADEVVVEAVGFLAREREHLLGARRVVVQALERALPRILRWHNRFFPW